MSCAASSAVSKFVPTKAWNAFNGVFPIVRLRILLNLVMFYTHYNNKANLENQTSRNKVPNQYSGQYSAKSISNRTVVLSYS